MKKILLICLALSLFSTSSFSKNKKNVVLDIAGNVMSVTFDTTVDGKVKKKTIEFTGIEK